MSSHVLLARQELTTSAAAALASHYEQIPFNNNMPSFSDMQTSIDSAAADQASSCLSYWRAGSLLQTSTLGEDGPLGLQYDFLTFLGVVQLCQFDFLPITWHPALENVGEGATAEIRQALIDIQMSYAFKRFRPSEQDDQKIFLQLISEVSILGLENIRDHPNVIKLEGIAWDIQSDGKVWPVLVFEKTSHGDLKAFFASGPGVDLPMKERLRFCTDIGNAVRDLHSCHVIHGDLSSRNILVFEDSPGSFVAKVSDFGYSSMVAEESSIYLPRTKPWYAPEWHHRAFSVSDAMKMDMFSFGLLCLWILFQNMPDFPATEEMEMAKADDKLLHLSDQLVTNATELDSAQKTTLSNFFHLALAGNPKARAKDFCQLLQLLPNNRSTVQVSAGILQTQPALTEANFNIVPNIMQFYFGDIRVRRYVAERLEATTLSFDSGTSPGSRLRSLMFQLALCYEIGFGVTRNSEHSVIYLTQSDMTREKFDGQVRLLTGEIFEQPYFHNSKFRAFRQNGLTQEIDFDRRSGEYQQLDTLEAEYRREIGDIEMVLGLKSPITIILKSRLSQILNSHGRWTQCEELSSQILTVSIDVFGKEHATTMVNMAGLAAVFWNQGRFSEAEKLEREVVELSKKINGPEHPETLTRMAGLASTKREQGEWNEAEYLFQYVNEKRRSLLGTENPIFLTGIAGLSWLYRSQGRWTDAETLETEVFETRKRVLGPDHPDTLSSMTNLATTLIHQGRWNAAENLFASVMQKSATVLGTDHPDTLSTMSHFASALGVQGNWEEAEKLQRQVLQQSLEIVGVNHRDTLATESDLALTCRKLGKWQEAEELIKRVIERQEESLGPNHVSTIGSKAILASIFSAQGQLKRAEDLALQTTETRRDVLGPLHPDTLQSMSHLGSIYCDKGQFGKAEQLFLEVMRNSGGLGAEHPEVLANISNMAGAHMQQGQLKKAEDLYVQLLEIYGRVQGKEHPDTQAIISNLALTYRYQGRLLEAKDQEAKLLEISSRVLGEEHPDTLVTMANLAMTLADLKNWDEANVLGTKAMQLMLDKCGPDNPDTLTSIHNMGFILLGQGNLDEAERLSIHVVKCRARVLGEEHPDTVRSSMQLNEVWERKRDVTGAS